MFTLTKLTPPPLVLLINLTICLCFSLPVQAKIIQRKMHMVCQEHESAYWDGSKGVCCDKSLKAFAAINQSNRSPMKTDTPAAKNGKMLIFTTIPSFAATRTQIRRQTTSAARNKMKKLTRMIIGMKMYMATAE